MNKTEKSATNTNQGNTPEPGNRAPAEMHDEQYSEAMVDTIFADTLSRNMQNAITKQQNAQMAEQSSILDECARILQSKKSKS